MTRFTGPSGEEISAALAARVEELAMAILGEPSSRTSTEWRWGSKGSFSMVVSGEKRGSWRDHEAATGGHCLCLIKDRECGGDIKKAFQWARQWLGIDRGGLMPSLLPSPTLISTGSPSAEAAARVAALTRDAKIERAMGIWNESLPIAGTIAETYLASRGLLFPDTDALRFHPECPREMGQAPALIARMDDPLTGEPTAIHRTFIKPDGSGKTPGFRNKMMLGVAGGAVIKLCHDAAITNEIAIAEGIETALAASQLFGIRTIWAAGSAGTIAAFHVLEGIERIVIFADNDDGGTGQRAAIACAERWAAAGSSAIILMPPDSLTNKGSDWADVLKFQTQGQDNERH